MTLYTIPSHLTENVDPTAEECRGSSGTSVRIQRQMKLYVMRHGIAEDSDEVNSSGEFDRALTMRGRKRIRQVGRALRDNWLLPDMIVASPVVRALQTAEIIAATLDPDEPVIVRRELAPGGDILSLVKELVDSDIESALLVGHEPELSEFVGMMVSPEAWEGPFSRGMVVALRVAPQGNTKVLFTMDAKRLQPMPTGAQFSTD